MDPLASTLHLHCDLAQLAVARDWFRSMLCAAGIDATDTLLVVTELVTNAITHARSSPTVTVQLSQAVIHLEVTDDLPTAPEMREQPDVNGGYGLRFVDQLAERWGWRPTTHGKVVWSDLPRRATC